MSEIITENDCKLSRFDVADYLTTEEDIKEYLEVSLESDDPEQIIRAINDVARARGMNELAQKMGVGRTSLYKSLNGDVKPRFETIYKALHALGVRLAIKELKSEVSQ